MANGKDIRMDADEELEDSGDPRVYELGFHLDPDLPAEEVGKAYKAIRDIITDKGTIVAEGEPEKTPLAYTISRQETAGRRDFDSAYFCWIAYEAAAPAHAEIVAAANADKCIIRFIDLLTTKNAARHAVEMRELSVKAPERAADPGATLAVELDAALESAGV